MKGDSKERLEAAVLVCQEHCFSKASIIRTVRNLLNVYGAEAGWRYIEENGYSNLVECIVAERNDRRDSKVKQHGVRSSIHSGASRALLSNTVGTQHCLDHRKDAMPQHFSQSSPTTEDSEEGSPPQHYQEAPDSPDIYRHQRRLWSLQVGLPSLSCFQDFGPVRATAMHRDTDPPRGQPRDVVAEAQQILDSSSSGDRPNKTATLEKRTWGAAPSRQQTNYVAPSRDHPRKNLLGAKNVSEKLTGSSHLLLRQDVPKSLIPGKGKLAQSIGEQPCDHVVTRERPPGSLHGAKQSIEKPKSSSPVSLAEKSMSSSNVSKGKRGPSGGEHSVIVLSGEEPIVVCTGGEVQKDVILDIEELHEDLSNMQPSQGKLQNSSQSSKRTHGSWQNASRSKHSELSRDVTGGAILTHNFADSSSAVREGQEFQESEKELCGDEIRALLKSKSGQVVRKTSETTLNLNGPDTGDLDQGGRAGIWFGDGKLAHKIGDDLNLSTSLEGNVHTTAMEAVLKKRGRTAERSAVKVNNPQSKKSLTARRDSKFPQKTNDGANTVGSKSIVQAAILNVPSRYGGKIFSQDSDERKISPAKGTAASGSHEECELLFRMQGGSGSIAVPIDNAMSKGLDVGRTTALKLGGKKGSNSLLQKRKKTVGVPDFLDDSPSPKGPSKEVCASRASPLASPTSYSKGNSRQKVPGFGRSLSTNDHRQGDHDASHDEVVAVARFSSSKSNFEAPKVAVPSPASEERESQHVKVTNPSTTTSASHVNEDKIPSSLRLPEELDTAQQAAQSTTSNRETTSPDLPPGFGNWASSSKVSSPTHKEHHTEGIDSNRHVLLHQTSDVPNIRFQKHDHAQQSGSISNSIEHLPVLTEDREPHVFTNSRWDPESILQMPTFSRREETAAGSRITQSATFISEIGSEEPGCVSTFPGTSSIRELKIGSDASPVSRSEYGESQWKFSSSLLPPTVSPAVSVMAIYGTNTHCTVPQTPVPGSVSQPHIPKSLQASTSELLGPSGGRLSESHGYVQPGAPLTAMLSSGLPPQAVPSGPPFISATVPSPRLPNIHPLRPVFIAPMPSGPLPTRPLPPWPLNGTPRAPQPGQPTFAPCHPSDQNCMPLPGPVRSFPPAPSCPPPFRPPPPHGSMNMPPSFIGTVMGQPPLPPGPPPIQIYPPGMEPPSPSPDEALPPVRPFSAIPSLPPQLESPVPWVGTVPNSRPGDGTVVTDLKRDAREHAKSVFVGNIPVGLPDTVALLQEALDEYLRPLECVPAKSGNIERISLYERSIGGYAFVQFFSDVMARIVLDACQGKSVNIQMNGVQLSVGRNLKAATAPLISREIMFQGDRHLDPTRILYIGNLPDHWRVEESLKKHLSESLGGAGNASNFVSEVYLLPQCVDVYVEFSSEAMADAMIYKCIKDPKLLECMGEGVFICRHPKFVPLFRWASNPLAASKNIKSDAERSQVKDMKVEALEQFVSKQQSTLYVGNLPLTAEAYSIQHLREFLDGILSKQLDKISVVGGVKSVTWPPGRHYAHVEFGLESTADSIMDSYIEQTPIFVFNDMALSVFRHQKYVRPGAVYKTSGLVLSKSSLNVKSNEEKSRMRFVHANSQGADESMETEHLEDGDDGSYNESGQVVHPEDPYEVTATSTSLDENPELGSIGGWNSNLYKTKLCSRFIQGDCPFNVRCKYAHGLEELRQPLPPTEVQGTRLPVTPPQSTGSQSSSTGTSETASRVAENSEGNDEYVDSKSVVCVRGLADGVSILSLKGALNELFERALLTAGVLEHGKHVVRYLQLKDNTIALVTLLSVPAATAILSVTEPLKLARQQLLLLPWSHMQQQHPRQPTKVISLPSDLQVSSLGDASEFVSASPATSRPPNTWVTSDRWASQPPPNPDCVPHHGVFAAPMGMAPRLYPAPRFHPLPSGPVCHPGFGAPGGFRPPASPLPWTPSRPQHLWQGQPSGGDGWPIKPWVEPLGPQSCSFGWRPMLGSEWLPRTIPSPQPGCNPLALRTADCDGLVQGQELTGRGDEPDRVMSTTTGGWIENDEEAERLGREVAINGQHIRQGEEREDVPEVGKIPSENTSAPDAPPAQPQEHDTTEKATLAGEHGENQVDKAMSDVSRCEKKDIDLKMSTPDQEPIGSRDLISSKNIDRHGNAEPRRVSKRKREFERLESLKCKKLDLVPVIDQEPTSIRHHDRHSDGPEATGKGKLKRQFQSGRDYRSSSHDYGTNRMIVHRNEDHRHGERERGWSNSREREILHTVESRSSGDGRRSSREQEARQNSHRDERNSSREREFQHKSEIRPFRHQRIASREREHRLHLDHSTSSREREGNHASKSNLQRTFSRGREGDVRQMSDQRSHRSQSSPNSRERARGHSIDQMLPQDQRYSSRDRTGRRTSEQIPQRSSSRERVGPGDQRSNYGCTASSRDRGGANLSNRKVDRDLSTSNREQEGGYANKPRPHHERSTSSHEREVRYASEEMSYYDRKSGDKLQTKPANKVLKRRWDVEPHVTGNYDAVIEKPDQLDQLLERTREVELPRSDSLSPETKVARGFR